MDEAPKYRGLIGTTVFHGVIIILMFLITLTATKPSEEAEGITINFGIDEVGSGALEPEEQDYNPPQQTAAATPPPRRDPVKEKVKEPAPNLMTQDVEDAPTLKKQTNEKDDAELKRLEEIRRQQRIEAERLRQEEIERQRIEEEARKLAEAERLKQEQQQAQVNAIKGRIGKSFGGNSTTTGAQGEGAGTTTGNQGDPTGSVDSNNRGPGGGKGAGISFSLEGRNVIGSLAKPEYNVNDYGTVVVQIKVNKEGNVISATPGVKGSTTADSRLLKAAEKAALQAKFNRVTSAEAPSVQQGTITYHFRLL